MTDTPSSIGKFRIDGLIGKGGMGVVYRGWDPTLERPVAIKVIHAHLCQGELGEQLLARFRNEAIAAARLSHPNVVPVYEFGEHDGSPFIAMAFIEGQELGNRLKAGERLTVESAVHVVTQVLRGLGYCHANGIVHRDLKPANILVQDDGGIKITDFGIARLESSDLTQTGAVLGTMSYMSPEQHLGQTVDHRSDLFSVGVVLYELLTGERPFAGRTNAMVLHNVMHSRVADPSRINVHVTPALSPIVHKALATHPGSRFQSAEEFADALQAAIAAEGATDPVARSPGNAPARAIQTADIGAASDRPAARGADGLDLVLEPSLTDGTSVDSESPTAVADGEAGSPASAASGVAVDPESQTVVNEALMQDSSVDSGATAVDPPLAGATGDRRRGSAPLIAGLCGVVAVAIVAGWWFSNRSPDPATATAPAAATAPETAPAQAESGVTTVPDAGTTATSTPSAPPVTVTDDSNPAAADAALTRSDASLPDSPAAAAAAGTGDDTPVSATPDKAHEPLTIVKKPLGGGFPNAMLRVDSTPSGAMFMLDGEPIGVTPLEVELRPGSYVLSLRKARHRPVKQRLEVERGSRVEVSSVLVAKE